jgi:uracil-DNA glycosylase
MGSVRLTLLIGQYAQRFGLGDAFGPTSTATLVRWAEFGPGLIPLPHPSPRNIAWFKRNAWFEGEVLPTLRVRVAAVLASQ